MNPERVCYGCFAEKEPGLPCPRCGFCENDQQPYLALPLGTILNGRYLVGKVLGMGGFGITYLGYDLTLEIKVAIKEYMPSALATRHPDHYSVALTGRVEADYQYGMERFLEEAKILAKLQNTPYIVSVQNYFQENGTAYFVMEYVDGMSLKAYLSKNGERISWDQAVAILKPIMEALVQVHALNLLHRDISPDNIYITAKGESRLLDFGAARFALGDGKSVSVILKRGYAPEEQYSSHGNQGPWTDVYAMGATMYRCITGQLPPDSVERIHGDTLKRPSELGVRVPPQVEAALLKALAVKTQDRFPNMEAFLGALSPRVSVQDQVAASISQRTQAASYGQTAYGQPSYGQTVYQPSPYRPPSYGGGGGKAGRPAFFSRLVSYLKANPAVAWVSGGGLLAVIALCVILPIALSGGGKTAPVGGGGGGGDLPALTVPVETPGAQSDPQESEEPAGLPESDPMQPEGEYVTRDLGLLNAQIDVPTDYTVSENGLNFSNEEQSRFVLTDYYWILGGAIYSLADVETYQEAIAAEIMEALEIGNYQILTAGPSQVGSYQAYQIHLEGTDSAGVSLELMATAVEGYDFGCYFLFAAYPTGDEEAREELMSIVQTFQSTGAPDTTYEMWYAPDAGVKVIVDSSLIQGGVVDMEWDPDDSLGTVCEMFLYPTQEDSEAAVGEGSCVEAFRASQYGLSTPEEVVQYFKDSSGTSNETYTFSSGGADWLAYDFSVSDKYFSYASAVIDGECYVVGCLFRESDRDTVATLYNQVISSVRGWEG